MENLDVGALVANSHFVKNYRLLKARAGVFFQLTCDEKVGVLRVIGVYNIGVSYYFVKKEQRLVGT